MTGISHITTYPRTQTSMHTITGGRRGAAHQARERPPGGGGRGQGSGSRHAENKARSVNGLHEITARVYTHTAGVHTRENVLHAGIQKQGGSHEAPQLRAAPRRERKGGSSSGVSIWLPGMPPSGTRELHACLKRQDTEKHLSWLKRLQISRARKSQGIQAAHAPRHARADATPSLTTVN